MEELSYNISTSIIFYTAVSTVNKDSKVIKGIYGTKNSTMMNTN